MDFKKAVNPFKAVEDFSTNSKPTAEFKVVELFIFTITDEDLNGALSEWARKRQGEDRLLELCNTPCYRYAA